MSIWLYDREVDDYLRSIENGSMSSSGQATIGAPLRDYFEVSADDNTKIQVPFRYLGDTARIDVSGSDSCTLRGEASFVVLITNNVDTTEARRIMKSAVNRAIGGAKEEVIEDIAESQKGRIARFVSPVANKLAAEIREGLQLSMHSTNKLAKTLTNLGTKAGEKAVKGVADKALGSIAKLAAGLDGIGTVEMAMEADDTGYERNFIGTSESGSQVAFLVTGTPRSS